jgi:hypothetical protein
LLRTRKEFSDVFLSEKKYHHASFGPKAAGAKYRKIASLTQPTTTPSTRSLPENEEEYLTNLVKTLAHGSGSRAIPSNKSTFHCPSQRN